MSVYINFVCEYPACQCVQPMEFTALSETFGDMINQMRELGWVVPLEEAKALLVLCPYHASTDRRPRPKNLAFFVYIKKCGELLGLDVIGTAALMDDPSWYACFDDGLTPGAAVAEYRKQHSV